MPAPTKSHPNTYRSDLEERLENGALCAKLGREAVYKALVAPYPSKPNKTNRNTLNDALYQARYLCVDCPALGQCARMAVNAVKAEAINGNDHTIFAGEHVKTWVERVEQTPKLLIDQATERRRIVDQIDAMEFPEVGRPYVYAEDVAVEIRTLRSAT